MNKTGKSIAMLLLGVVMFSFLPSCGIIQQLEELQKTLEQIQILKPNYRFYSQGTSETVTIYAFNIKDSSKTKIVEGNTCKKDNKWNSISGICSTTPLGSALISDDFQTIALPRVNGLLYFKDGAIYTAQSDNDFSPVKLFEIPTDYVLSGLYSNGFGAPIISIRIRKNSTTGSKRILINISTKKSIEYNLENNSGISNYPIAKDGEISGFILKKYSNYSNASTKTYSKCNLDFECSPIDELKDMDHLSDYNGNYFYFTKTENKIETIYQYDATTGQVSKVTNEEGREFTIAYGTLHDRIQYNNGIFLLINYNGDSTFTTLSGLSIKTLFTIKKEELPEKSNLDIVGVYKSDIFYAVREYDSNWNTTQFNIYKASLEGTSSNIETPFISATIDNQNTWYWAEFLNGYIQLLSDTTTIYSTVDGTKLKEMPETDEDKGTFSAYTTFNKFESGMMYINFAIYDKNTKKLTNYDYDFNGNEIATIDYPAENTMATGTIRNRDLDFPGTFTFYSAQIVDKTYHGSVSLYAYDKENGLVKVESADNLVIKDPDNDIPLKWIGGFDN